MTNCPVEVLEMSNMKIALDTVVSPQLRRAVKLELILKLGWVVT